MRFRTTIILFVILLATGAYLYFVERPKQEAAAKKPTLYQVEADDVTAVKLAYADREIDVVKQDGKWMLTKPVQAAGDESSIKNLVNSVATCEVTKELTEPSADLKGYGLDTPFVTVSFGTKDDK